MIELPNNLTRGALYDLFNRLHRAPAEKVSFRGFVGFITSTTLSESIHKPEIIWELHLKVAGEDEVKVFKGSYSGLMPPPVPPPRTRFQREDVL